MSAEKSNVLLHLILAAMVEINSMSIVNDSIMAVFTGDPKNIVSVTVTLYNQPESKPTNYTGDKKGGLHPLHLTTEDKTW